MRDRFGPIGRRRINGLGAAAVGLCVVIGASCGGSDSGSEGSLGAEGTAGEAAESIGAPTGTLRYAALLDATTLDPQKATDSVGVAIRSAYDTLTAVEGGEQVVPWLATSWEQIDPTTWRFELRDDVVFHDGSKFDAETVKLNLERGRALTSTPFAGVYSRIESVEVVDPTTVDVKLTSPNPMFLMQMAQNAGSMISPEAIREDLDLTNQTAGSGGWIYDQDASGQGVRVFTANPDYWNPAAVRAAEVSVTAVPDQNARLNGLQTGAFNIIESISPNLGATLLDQGFQMNTIVTKVDSLLVIDRGGEKVEALADPRVRQAIALLIDPAAYDEAVYDGWYSDMNDQRGYFPASSEWYVPASNEVLRGPDIDAARELLADAGYPNGFEISVPSEPPAQPRLDVVAQMLAQADITLKQVPVPDLLAAAREGDAPLTFTISKEAHPQSWYDAFISTSSGFNPFELTDVADLDAQMEAAASMTDEEDRKAIYDEVQLEVKNRGIFIPLHHSTTEYMASADVEGAKYWTSLQLSVLPYGVTPGEG